MQRPTILRQDPYIPVAVANLADPTILSGNHPSNDDEKYGFIAIKAMITSALIWVSIASWVDIIQEYMLIKTPIPLENQEPSEVIESRQCFRDRLKLRLQRRLIFAVLITIVTAVVAWWFHWRMIKSE